MVFIRAAVVVGNACPRISPCRMAQTAHPSSRKANTFIRYYQLTPVHSISSRHNAILKHSKIFIICSNILDIKKSIENLVMYNLFDSLDNAIFIINILVLFSSIIKLWKLIWFKLYNNIESLVSFFHQH